MLFFKTPSAYELAVRQLADAERDLLNMCAQYEYTKKMLEYQQNLVTRLTAYVDGKDAGYITSK